MSELFRLRRSEGYGACDDDIPVWVSAWVRRDFDARLRNKKHLTKIQSGSKVAQVVGQQITQKVIKNA